MVKNTKLIIAALGLGGLGYFLYKKGYFTNMMPKTNASEVPKPPPPTKATIKNPPTCPSGTKLQLVDIDCNGQDCEVHCVVIPPVPERKIMPIDDVITTFPIDDKVFKKVPENPVIFYPYSDKPIEVILNPYVGIPQNSYVQVTDNTFNRDIIFVEQDPFKGTARGKGSLDYELNQLIYR
jgi:hypothetical protein